MISATALWDAWAPEGAVWSAWAKPVLFARPLTETWMAAPDVQEPEVPWAPDPRERTAVVVDVPGGTAVGIGMALARKGYQPVPLFNGCWGSGEAVDTDEICHALVRWAPILAELRVPSGGPPAFLLDSRRGGAGRRPPPGAFDNRWIVFPQDFPSANLLLSHGIRSVILYASGSLRATSDVAHVLRRWQDAGMRILQAQPGGSVALDTLVPKPSGFRLVWYRALALLGFGRAAAGGFGARIPKPPPEISGGGGRGFYGGFG